jgi:AAA+ ATPase superfamily predicted ATPase
LALVGGGALLCDVKQRQTERITPLEKNQVLTVLTGREGNLWFGTDNGVVFADIYSFVSFTTSRGLPDNDSREMVTSPDGALWCVTATGVSRLQDERFAPIPQLRSVNNLRDVAFDKTGAAWFASAQGAVKLSGQTLTQFGEGNGLVSNNIHAVSSIANGSAMAFATAKGASVYHDGVFDAIDDLDGYDVRHIFEDTDRRLWFSTSRGVMLYNPQQDTSTLLDTTRGLIDNDTRWITRFNGELLIATRSGIVIYNERQQGSAAAFKPFDNEPTTTLFVDRDGFLWSGTESGQVKKFLAVRGHIITTIYSGEANALTANRISSIAEDKDGNIWIATDKGVVRHRPVRLAPAAQVSMRLGGQTERPFDAANREVPNGRERLTFRMTGVSMSGQVRYLYRLNAAVGEADWEFLPAQQAAEREVSLFEVGEGAHTFEVIALNRDLYGASSPSATLSFRVSSPFWKRWWFYAITLAIVGVAATAFFVAHRRQQREYVLPKELREFKPIERNPYIVGNPIRTEKMFYGREDDFRYVRTKLEGVSQGVVIVFCGERRVGKSSILYQLVNGRLGDRFVPVFVDMQEMVITSEAELFSRITRLLVDSLQRKQVQIAAPNFNGHNPYLVFGDFLDQTLAAIGERVLLILIDEYELMESKVDEGKLSPDFFTYLAGLMDNKERLAFIFTGSRRLEERDKKYWRELLRRSLFRKVGFLTKNDTLRLVTEPVEGRVVYGRGVLDAICRLTAGQPFYTQVTCQNIIDYLNEHEQNWLTLADLDKVTAEIVDNPLPQMIYTWEALSDDEKLVLSLLAECLADGEAFATAFDLRNSVRLNDYPVNLSEATIRLTLEEMFHREVLDKNAGDGFRIKIDLFRLWIRRSHSIWKVVKEVRTL